MNTKSITRSFKRRFLPQFSTKSRLLPLSGCGNERGRGRTREKRERGVSRQSIWLKSQLGCLHSWRTSLYIGLLIVTVRSKRSTVRWNGPSWTVSIKSWPSDRDGRPRFDPMKRFIKMLQSRPLILDPTVRMSPSRFDLDRYNASDLSTCVDVVDDPCSTQLMRVMPPRYRESDRYNSS